MRGRPLAAALSVALASALAPGALAPGGLAAAAAAGPSLPTVERQVMCVTCKIPLNVAQSPQADRERAFIAGLIAQGDSEAQIKRALVVQYGPSVLALPSARGFDLAAYLVPLAAVLALALALALLLPRWRRRARAQAERSPPQALSAGESARLDADMARFD
jgi:cytochrome c-type biogenesis protein CcmH